MPELAEDLLHVAGLQKVQAYMTKGLVTKNERHEIKLMKGLMTEPVYPDVGNSLGCGLSPSWFAAQVSHAPFLLVSPFARTYTWNLTQRPVEFPSWIRTNVHLRAADFQVLGWEFRPVILISTA